MDPLKKKKFTFSGIQIFVGITTIWFIQSYFFTQIKPKAVSYNEFLANLREDKIQEILMSSTELMAILKPDGGQVSSKRKSLRIIASRLPNIDETTLLKEIENHQVTVYGKFEQVSWWANILIGWMLPIGIFMLIYYYGMRRLNKGGGPLSFGRSKAKIYDQNQQDKVTFEHVAGVDEAKGELVEIVDFLKNPTKYESLGARIPKGVLLVGPPGTGKTLLAKAVAGEAGVSFFSMSGSDFVEMFVGVGASRVRDLFEQAKQRAPCIIFIDEIDAIGRSRGGVAAMATHDEREQTLNQLLAEMDGFDASKGVVILAATNRPEVLDHALLRAGRFNRQVVVDRPDINGREAILNVHVKKINVVESIKMRIIAQRTPGMVGADLEKVVNEAALAAVRRGADTTVQKDFEEAIDRIQLGLAKRGRVMTDDEKRRVAFHESGHALVALSLPHVPPVHRVTIIPRSIGALGVTLQLPTEDRYLMTREELRDQICVMLGGRVAEELLCNDISTGAQNDFERATEMSRQIVCSFGMSDKMGLVMYGRPTSSQYLDGFFGRGNEKNYSEETAQKIDTEIRTIIDKEHERARKIIEKRKDALEVMTRELLEKETLDRDELTSLVGPQPVPTESCNKVHLSGFESRPS